MKKIFVLVLMMLLLCTASAEAPVPLIGLEESVSVELTETSWTVSVEAQSGDALAYEYRMSGGVLEVSVDGGSPVVYASASDEWRQSAEAVGGDAAVQFAFVPDGGEEAFCEIRSLRLLSGEEAAAALQRTYVVLFTDENGAPVAGVMAQICNDSLCMVFSSDAEGRVEFANAAYPYEVHVLMAPQGYEAVAETYVLPAAGGELTIILPAA